MSEHFGLKHFVLKHFVSRHFVSKHAGWRRSILAVLAAGAFATAPQNAEAEYTAVEVNFIVADKDGDLLLSKTEYLLIPLETFMGLDQNKNNAIEADEIGDLSDDPEYLDGDADKSGSLSLEEMIEEKLADFKAADTDEDGALNVDEVTAFETNKKE